MFNAIEKFEVAVRAKIVQTYCESTGSSHWFNDKSLYKEKEVTDKNVNKTTAFDLLMADIECEIKRSNENFIKHYNKKNDTPVMPPAWMTLEVLSLGTLSRMYQLLKKSPEKKRLQKHSGLTMIKFWQIGYMSLLFGEIVVPITVEYGIGVVSSMFKCQLILISHFSTKIHHVHFILIRYSLHCVV